jgi:hypothetical protein
MVELPCLVSHCAKLQVAGWTLAVFSRVYVLFLWLVQRQSGIFWICPRVAYLLHTVSLLYSCSLGLITQTLDVSPPYKHVACGLSNQPAQFCLFQRLEVSFSVLDFWNVRTFSRKQSMFHRTAVFEKLIMFIFMNNQQMRWFFFLHFITFILPLLHVSTRVCHHQGALPCLLSYMRIECNDW